VENIGLKSKFGVINNILNMYFLDFNTCNLQGKLPIQMELHTSHEILLNCNRVCFLSNRSKQTYNQFVMIHEVHQYLHSVTCNCPSFPAKKVLHFVNSKLKQKGKGFLAFKVSLDGKNLQRTTIQW
jgi:hypothetical protein